MNEHNLLLLFYFFPLHSQSVFLEACMSTMYLARSSRMLSQETSASPVPSSPATGTPSLSGSKHDEQTPTSDSPSPAHSNTRSAVQFDLTCEEEKRFTPRPQRRQSRNSSCDSSAELCNCPPEAKIPRPRNGMLFLDA